jgi:hypothetical protein
MGKIVKHSHNTPIESQEERYIFYSFMISGLDAGEWSASRPDRVLSPEKRSPLPTG